MSSGWRLTGGAARRGLAGASAATVPFHAVPALADPLAEALAIVDAHASALAVGLAAAAILIVLWFRLRYLKRALVAARAQQAEAEAARDDIESAMQAEPHVLMIWRGRDAEPERIVGDMRGTATIPGTREQLLELGGWLEPESAAALGTAVAALRESGAPFNIGVRTQGGELLEADGRTAGGQATLRLRPLAGERLQVTELSFNARKLGKQVERLSAVIELAPLPVWLRDAAGKLIWANRSYVKAVESPDTGAVVAHQIEIANIKKLDAPPQGSAPSFVGRGHAVIGGVKRALDVHEVALSDGSAGFAVDMTELSDAKREFKRLADAHTKTLERLDTAVAIFGPNQRLRFHNKAYQDLWSFDPDWLAQSPSESEILDRLRANRQIPEQANYRDWKNRLLQVYTTVEPKEDLWHLPDGRSIHVVCEQHPFGGVTWLYENATKEFELETRVNELFVVQKETLDNLGEGIALFGTDGRLKLHNPAFARFWALDEARLGATPHVDQIVAAGRKLLDDDLHWDEIKYGVTGLEAGRKPLKGRVVRADGLVLDFASIPLADGNTLISYMDVTDNSRMERALRERAEALEAADRLKTGFMSNVSYQLRTPLTNIIGFAEAMTIGIAGELQSKQHEYLRHIQTSSEDLLAIINAILDLTTIDAGAMELTRADIDAAEVLEAAASELADRIAKRDLTLAIEVAPDLGAFSADRTRVLQMLRHVLDNAIHYSNIGGEIRMGARRHDGAMLLWVHDDGRGIAPEFQAKVFDRFHARSEPGGHRGAGLGLAMVKALVELHGGSVSLLSMIGKGTTVICKFPQAAAKTEAAE